MEKIFVQIASYRDPQLVKTIDECINNCSDPSRLTFGVCWQHDENDAFDQEYHKYINDPRFKTIDIPWQESKGLCWARSKIQKLYNNEEYTLQIDSHHLFAKNWDLFLINELKRTKSNKPLLTAYCAAFEALNPNYPKDVSGNCYIMWASRFTSYGTIMFRGKSISEVMEPVPARFVSGHFFFTTGKHCIEYKYDPNVYFAGDEISLSLRSYTLGYDLFHPSKNVIWHDYSSYKRQKHWTDHVPNSDSKVDYWYNLDANSKKRLRQLLRMEDNKINLGEYDIGTTRTLEDYERYAGLDFKKRLIHENAYIGISPPSTGDMKWTDNYRMYYIEICRILEHFSFEKESFYYIGFDTEDNKAVYYGLYPVKEIQKFKEDWMTIKFTSTKEPVKFVIIGQDARRNWTKRLDFKIDNFTKNICLETI